VTYAGFLGDLPFIAMNGNGQIAFVADLKGVPGKPVTQARGLFATDINGQVHLIARAGAPLDLGGGDTRIPIFISFTSFPGADAGQAVAFTDDGAIAFTAQFVGGGGGVFIAWVPEPTIILPVMIGGLLLTRRAERRKSLQTRDW
jgi:hypothetical protein